MNCSSIKQTWAWFCPWAMRVSAPELKLTQLGLPMFLAWEFLQSPFYTDTFTESWTGVLYNRVHCTGGDMIIISASGMATGGRVLHHLMLRLPDPKTTLLFVGFQAEGTRGRTLQDGKTEIKMLGEMVQIRAKVKTIDGFSAHADQQEILRRLRSFKKAPIKTFVIHGEPPGSEALATLLREQLRWNTEVPRNGAMAVLS